MCERTIPHEELLALLVAEEAEADRLEAEAERRMREAGRKPARRDDLWVCGDSTFSLSLRWRNATDDALELKVRHWDDEACVLIHLWGDPWPEPGVVVSATATLDLLVRHWLLVAAPHLHAGRTTAASSPAHTVDFASIATGVGLPPLFLDVVGPSVVIRSGASSFPHHRNGVVVVETLMAIGGVLADGLLARDLADATVAAWRDLVRRTDLPPARPAATPTLLIDRALDAAEVAEDAAYWAARLGQDPGAYRAAAVWLLDANRLHNVGRGPEPTVADWDVTRIPDVLPDEAGVLAIGAGMAAADPGFADAGAAIAHAVALRNLDARQAVLFDRLVPSDGVSRPR